jgi:protein-L-isoaspartate O-methyltransferase
MKRVSYAIDLIRRCGWFAVFVPALLFVCQPASAQTVPIEPSPTDAGKYLEHIVPYVPTPMLVAQKMLEVAKVVPDDVVYDLGSGDGRIVIMAAQKFGAHAVGVELDSDLYQKSSERIRKLNLQDRAQIIHENMFEVNVRHATVVTLYLLTAVNERLRPKLERELRSGARIVSHDFQVPGWQPAETVEVNSENQVASKVYLYVRP